MINFDDDLKKIYREQIQSLSDDNFLVVVDKDITLKNVEQAAELDTKTYDTDFCFSSELCLSMLTKNNMLYSMIIDRKSNEVVGYLNLSPLKKESYLKLKEGEITDGELTADDITEYNTGAPVYLYFASIIISSKNRKLGLGEKLFKSIGYKLDFLAKNGVKFNSILFDTLTIHGEKFSKKLGATFYKNSIHGSSIFECDLNSNSKFEDFINKLKIKI